MKSISSTAYVADTSEKLLKRKQQAASDAKKLKRKAKQDAKKLAENVADDIYTIRHSLRVKLSIRYLIVLAAVSVMLIAVGLISTYYSNLKTTELTSRSSLSTAAGVVERSLGLMLSNAEMAGSSEVLSNPASQLSDKMKTVKLLKNLNKYVELGFIDADGHGYSGMGMMDFSDYEHFKVAIKGDKYISEPLQYGAKKAWSVITATPNYNGDKIIGTVYIVDKMENINDKIAALSFGKTGYAYVLNQDGKVIYHHDIAKAQEGFNAIELSRTDSSYADMAKAVNTILDKNQGSVTYNNNGVKMYAAFLPVPGFEQWTVVLEAPYSEFMGSIVILAILGCVAAAIMLAFCVWFCRKDVSAIIKPLAGVKERMQLLSVGDLTSPVPSAVADDEIGRLSVALASTVGDLRQYIEQLSLVLAQMANSDFTAQLQGEFTGDFIELKISIDKILSAFNDTLSGLHRTVADVSKSSEQLARDAIVLSDGATQQASAVSKLLSSIKRFRAKTADNALSINDAAKNATETNRRLGDSNAQMSQLIIAMNEISQKSSEIGKIVSTIEDISLQTNILALNASVEAAHAAGKAGKGFAVVAMEVRELAAKSSEAAGSTKELIEASIAAVAKGVRLAHATGDSMQAVALKASNIVTALDGISASSVQQEALVNDITAGADRIAGVVHTNSATAQQSASASEELSAQAAALSTIVSRFRLCGIDYTEHSANTEALATQAVPDADTQVQADAISSEPVADALEPAAPAPRKRKPTAKKPAPASKADATKDKPVKHATKKPTKPKAEPKATARKAPTKKTISEKLLAASESIITSSEEEE